MTTSDLPFEREPVVARLCPHSDRQRTNTLFVDGMYWLLCGSCDNDRYQTALMVRAERQATIVRELAKGAA